MLMRRVVLKVGWLSLLSGVLVSAACSPMHAHAEVVYPTHTSTPFLPQVALVTNTHLPTPSATAIPSPILPTATDTAEWTPTVTFAPVPFSEGPITIGYSEGRRPIEIYRFGTGEKERLIVAGIHGGNEYNTTLLAYELIEYIDENPDVIPDVITLYILPSLNPDGAARGRGIDARLNESGVDLNRNWPFNWQEEWPEYGCWYELPASAGPYPASEPETVSLMTFILFHDIEALISYHSAALGIFAGGVPDFPPSLSLAEAVAAVSDYPYPPIDTGCAYTGNLSDWAASQGIAAVDIELTDHAHTDFWQNVRILKTFLKWFPPDE